MFLEERAEDCILSVSVYLSVSLSLTHAHAHTKDAAKGGGRSGEGDGTLAENGAGRAQKGSMVVTIAGLRSSP